MKKVEEQMTLKDILAMVDTIYLTEADAKYIKSLIALAHQTGRVERSDEVVERLERKDTTTN